MHIPPILRVLAAVAVGIAITVAIGFFTFIVGLPYRLLIHPWLRQWTKNPLTAMPRLWGTTIHCVCLEGMLGIRTELAVRINRPIGPDELVVCIANHPPSIGLASFFWAVLTRILPRIVAVAKREHLTNVAFGPFFGWPLWAIHGGIFIDRTNAASACESLRNGIRRLASGSLIMIFPDMRRPTAARIEADRERFAGRVDGIEHFTRTLVPRSGGLLEILQALDRPVRVMNITNAFSGESEHLLDAAHICGHTLHIEIEELEEPLPRDQAALQAWLNQEWWRKNAQIKRWQMRLLRRIA
ncbi:1-acyl-sn-glycerol-3-phosphate acyltransferase [Candidatus Uhrbacteria bacterium]|nr:1-acyl-sn-glycerol-3-phosphate acyltransferase [Candidatus Uhrbacteria bacterium]